jgi:hypothetical protein
MKSRYILISLSILTTWLASCAEKTTSCAGKPWNDLAPQDVTLLNLENGEANESGIAYHDRSTGYSITAEADQNLVYQTDANVCVWVFTPDSNLLSSGKLPQTGTYIIQIAALQGSQTFDLLVKLEGEDSPTTSSSPANGSTTLVTSPSTSDLTQDEAVNLVNRWLQAKPRIFGPPFDRNLLSQLATGDTYEDNLGSIEWLTSNGYRYVYTTSRIENVWQFSNSGQPFIKVNVYEDLTLYGPRGIDRSNSGANTRNFLYFFAKDSDGQWKISNYRRTD